MTVDAHVHLFDRGFLPAEWYKKGTRRWAAGSHPPRDASRLDIEGGLCDPDGQLLFADMRAAGVDSVICLSLDWDHGMGTSPTPLDDIHSYYGHLQREHPGRFFAVAAVDPRRPNATDLLETAFTEHGLIGLKLYPPRGYAPGDDICAPILQVCAEHDRPVVIHTAFVGWPHQGYYANPLLVGAAQARFPELTYVLAHSGHPLWLEECLLVTSSHPSTFAEFSNWNELIEHEPDRYVRLLCRARDAVGPHRLIFGSDQLGGPRFSGDRSHMIPTVEFVNDLPNQARKLGLEFGDEDLRLFLDDNARRAFRLDRNAPSPDQHGASS